MNKKDIAKNTFIYLGLVLVVLGYMLKKGIQNSYELEVYDFARCIANGLVPYKDISMIITPLFPIISSFVLKLFGDEMVILRIAGCVQAASILFVMYKIFTRLNVKPSISIIFVLRTMSFLRRNLPF